MTMMSYSQNGEDIRLARALRKIERGYFIDVGAAHPVFHSVTKYFSALGWTGVNIEPGKDFFDAIVADRPHDVNLNQGLSNRDGRLTFHQTIDSPGMSSFSDDFVAGLEGSGIRYTHREVEVTTLAKVCADHVGDRTIDFLKIDVEGHEREVIEGADWTRWRPRVLVIEATKPETWEPRLFEHRYDFVVSDGINRYFVREEDRALASDLALPPSVLDDYELYHYICQIEALRAERAILQQRIDELNSNAPTPTPTPHVRPGPWRRLLRLGA